VGAVWPQVWNRREPPRPIWNWEFTSRSGCWVGSSGSCDAHSFYSPILHNQHVRLCSLDEDIRRWHQSRGGFRTRITRAACRGVLAQRVRRRRGDRAVGILGVGEGSRRRTAPSPRSGRGVPVRSPGRETRRIRECGPARATAPAVSRIEAISKQFETNSRNSLLFSRSAVRLLWRP